MATKKFIIEVEEGETRCRHCPYHDDKRCRYSEVNGDINDLSCREYNLATMKITVMEEDK